MQVWPVLLDAIPAYLGRSRSYASLLRTPLGSRALVAQLLEHIAQVTPEAPTIVAPPGADHHYVEAMQADCPSAVIATSSSALNLVLAHAEPSDVLLFVDARCLPVDGGQLASLISDHGNRNQMARHLIGYAMDLAGTRESVNVDERGQVRSVQRYYKPATWPFIACVAASVVPVSSGLLPIAHLPPSLVELRQLLVSRGVPSADVVMRAGGFDLTSEEGLLAAAEHTVDRAVQAGGAQRHVILTGEHHDIHPTARLLGPMIVQDGVHIGAGATIVGPALIGAGATIGAHSVVAHALIDAGAQVVEGQVVRDRAWFAFSERTSAVAAGGDVPSFSHLLVRQGLDPAAGLDDDERAAYTPRPPLYPLVKRAIDAAVAAVALLALSPVLGLIAALVRLDSRGPIIFPHPREGVDGRLFNCLKFRTMRVGASEQQRRLKEQSGIDGPHFKIAGDPRITAVGRLLRATNVDELPQLVNVLIGDMSLVGPRPSPFRENQVCVPWRYGRLSVRPGITGLWQVCRHDRDRGDFHQWIEYDLLYVQQLGWMLDLKILAATLFTLGGKHPVPVSWLVPASTPEAQVVAHVPAAPAPLSPRQPLASAERPARSAP